jgi:hypothetical protein
MIVAEVLIIFHRIKTCDEVAITTSFIRNFGHLPEDNIWGCTPSLVEKTTGSAGGFGKFRNSKYSTFLTEIYRTQCRNIRSSESVMHIYSVCTV